MTEPIAEKNAEIIKPWYKQFWPWFLIGLLAYSVVQGLTLLTIATKNPPGLISDDYYDVGKGINQSLERENHAIRLKLHATLLLNDDNGTATLQLSGNSSDEPDLAALFTASAPAEAAGFQHMGAQTLIHGHGELAALPFNGD